eukprot:365013-Chlamydomonas_euryale.AAC.2
MASGMGVAVGGCPRDVHANTWKWPRHAVLCGVFFCGIMQQPTRAEAAAWAERAAVRRCVSGLQVRKRRLTALSPQPSGGCLRALSPEALPP